MTRLGTAGALLVGLVGVACGVIQLAQQAPPTANTCVDNGSCASEFPEAGAEAGTPTCQAGSCVSATGGFIPILVVSPPSGAANIGGATFGIPGGALPTTVVHAPGNACADFSCIPLPPMANGTDGTLSVGLALAVSLWPPAGLRPNQPDPNPGDLDPTTLPVKVVLHPMWVDPVTGTPMDATSLGLPLNDIVASNGCPTTNGLAPQPTMSDAGGGAFAYCAYMPQPYAPSQPSGDYEVEIVPSSPFDVFPPSIQVMPIPLAAATLDQLPFIFPSVVYEQLNTDLGKNPIRSVSLPITTDPGALPTTGLAGWHMYYENADGRRISSIATLTSDNPQTVVLYDATGSDIKADGDFLFVDPPAGVDLPRMSFTALSGSFNLAAYPALPPPVVTSGFVRRSDNLTATTAQITFLADGTASAYLVGTAGNGSPQLDQLLYMKTVTTDTQGQYSASLPPGVYRVYVVPDDPTLALTISSEQVLNTGAVGLHANPRIHVKGQVVLGNGTPVYGADVLVGSSADLPLAIPRDDVLARPREARGVTDASGHFDVLSDPPPSVPAGFPGPLDVSIRPLPGTNLPWIVRTNVQSNLDDGGVPEDVTLPAMVMPLPTPYPPTGSPGVLTDSSGSAIPNALVRAYAFPPPLPPLVDGGTPLSRGARLIGMTTTDESGNFQLFVVPPDP